MPKYAACAQPNVRHRALDYWWLLTWSTWILPLSLRTQRGSRDEGTFEESWVLVSMSYHVFLSLLRLSPHIWGHWRTKLRLSLRAEEASVSAWPLLSLAPCLTSLCPLKDICFAGRENSHQVWNVLWENKALPWVPPSIDQGSPSYQLGRHFLTHASDSRNKVSLPVKRSFSWWWGRLSFSCVLSCSIVRPLTGRILVFLRCFHNLRT